MRTPIALACLFGFTAATLAQDPDLPTQDLHKGGPPPASPPGLATGATEDQMWKPPTKEDWARPVLIQWERTWGDAVAVAKETNKPILVCINMDGEIASEHYAGVHYRNPETAKLFADYVCVIASVYRHTPRDFDEAGNRIPCPRFGCVTCGEHIAIEPLLYAKFMGGQRISPRHIMVELDGKEMYDVFYAWDNKSILDTIQNGIAQRTAQPRIVVRGDRPVLERVGSRAREDREAVEEAYRQGDRAQREQLLRAALAHPEAAPIDLLRLAVFDVDEGLAGLARQALIKVQSPGVVDVLAEALRVPLPDGERQAMVAALERLRELSPQARLLANVHRGLDASSKSVDLQGWGARMAGGNGYRAADSTAVERRADVRAAAVAADPANAEARLDLAEATLELAIDPATSDRYWGKNKDSFGKLLIEDARRHVDSARKLGAKGWRADAAEALCCYWSGETRKAHDLAIAAAAAMPPQPESLVAVNTLALFAEARIDAIWDALRKKTDWPGEWMTDVNSAFAVLARHPLGNDGHAVVHFDFLYRLGAKRRAESVLDQALERWPTSAGLHDRLRQRLLEGEGVTALRRRYDELLARKPDDAATLWFAGYAAMVEAEFQRRDKHPERAVEAYRRAITQFDGAIQREAGFEATANHYVALALSGLARLSIEADDLNGALELCLAGIARHPEATPVVDGLEISPVQTANLLETRLEVAKDTAGLERLRTVLRGLDPRLLELPEYERASGNTGQRRRERRGR
ncbi:MAG: hypothetical protein IPK26_25020 [Planctomycetes bacterium]|nr:hypothetical protein [Planctomycetota bacterium]